MTLRSALGLPAVLVMAACQGGAPAYPPSGAVQPTVAGRQPAVFTRLAEGRCAFTRSCDSLTATLEDASWLRLEGDPQIVEAGHRAYFQYGYTTFQIELRSRTFTKPTQECFVLTDSEGRKVDGSPLGYEGSPCLVDDRYYSTFSLSFRHVLTASLRWIRLTRVADGATVEWTFDACAAPPAQCAAPGPGRTGGV